MSGIVRSASVRQNLLSLQSTAELLATTQNRLATGKKVNTGLDNPTNFFTAASLDNRASDINNLLDGISNGVQVLQAANTGITSLQKLVDSAKSVANQTLQAAVGYSTKSSVTTAAIFGATADDLRGTLCYVNAQVVGSTPLGGLTLTIGATGNGTATNITFGDGTGGTVKSLNGLNAKLSSNNLLATIASNGAITITTTNDAASSTIGTIGGTAAGAGKAFNGLAAAAPVQDAAAQLVRCSLISRYNNILDQITTTARDASYNGINLLNGDQLKLTFNNTGTSILTIQGVTFNSAGLNLSKLVVGTDFLDNASANNAIASLNKASSQLRTETSTLGSNLSIVQIRQDFSKNLINVLQTGSSNLALADTNEEAANSQALSTRQSIAVSALALANQSQQSVLQLLR
jgi:flagellin-like hook-associated protein FlgL